jgi:hypothetical protein
MTRFRLALAGGALAIVLVVVAVVLAVGGSEGGAAPTTEATTSTTAVATTVTLAPGTLPPTVARTTSVATTVAPTPTSSSTTTTTVAPTTLPPTTAGSTSTTDPDPDAAPAFPCRADLLLTAYAAVQKVPPGATAQQPRCYGIWASVILAAPGLDRAFAVFGPGPGGWQLLNAGTAFVCQRLEVPDPAYTTIGCVDWDR